MDEKIMSFKKSNFIDFIHTTIIIILLAAGCFLICYGVSEHNKVTYESFSSPEGIVILGDNDTVIEDMKFIVSESHRIIDEEGWRRAMIEFNSSCRTMNLYFSLPRMVDYAHAINKTKTSFLYFNSSYDNSKDRSGLFLSYTSSENTNRMQLDFDWKICEKISYDQWRVEIAFENPYFGRPLFTHIQSVQTGAGLGWVPQISRLDIQIEGYLPIDLSYTSPQPSYYYILDVRTSVYWKFVSKNQEISSVRAVFQDPALSMLKSGIIFQSGLFIGSGISVFIGGLREIIDLVKRKVRT